MTDQNTHKSPSCPSKVNLNDLMQGKKKLIIQHGAKPYLLSITRKGRLILTSSEEGIDTCLK